MKLVLTMIAAVLMSCGAKEPVTSGLNDVGFGDEKHNKYVLYFDSDASGDWVVLRRCHETELFPLTRLCEAVGEERYMHWLDYAESLPFRLGVYQYEPIGSDMDERLELVQDRMAAASSANSQNGQRELVNLTPIRDALVQIIEFRRRLMGNEIGMTYYNFQSEYNRFLEPFFRNAPRRFNQDRSRLREPRNAPTRPVFERERGNLPAEQNVAPRPPRGNVNVPVISASQRVGTRMLPAFWKNIYEDRQSDLFFTNVLLQTTFDDAQRICGELTRLDSRSEAEWRLPTIEQFEQLTHFGVLRSIDWQKFYPFNPPLRQEEATFWAARYDEESGVTQSHVFHYARSREVRRSGRFHLLICVQSRVFED